VTQDTPPVQRTVPELEAILRKRTSVMEALVAGLGLSARTAATGVLAAVLYGVVSGVVGYQIMQWVIGLREASPEALEVWVQICGAFAVLSGLYGIIQFTKRDRVSRASWAPALFAVPLALATIGFALLQSGQARQIGPVVLQFVTLGWGLLWMSFGGAITAIVWNRAAKNVVDGRPGAPGELIEEVGRRWLDVAGPHGAKVHAVTIGMQFVLPGIFYALQLAFTDMVVVLDPERAALKRASQLSSGMRGRIFRLLLVTSLITYALWFGVLLPIEGVTDSAAAIEKMQELFLDPSASSFAGYVAGEVVFALSTWVTTMALLALYLEREAQVKARGELKKLKAEAKGDLGPSTQPALG
jgi:hypothetical protein